MDDEWEQGFQNPFHGTAPAQSGEPEATNMGSNLDASGGLSDWDDSHQPCGGFTFPLSGFQGLQAPAIATVQASKSKRTRWRITT